MKLLQWLGLVLLLNVTCLPLGVSAEEVVSIPSKITDVTVFRDRAVVTRKLTLNLNPGVYQVHIADLPGTLEENSIQAHGKGVAKVKLYGARLVSRELAEEQSPQVRLLQDQIQDVLFKIQTNQQTKNGLEQKRLFLNSIQAASAAQIGKDLITQQPSVTTVKELADYIEQELAVTYKKDVDLDVQQRELGREMDRLHRELQKLDGSAMQTNQMAVDLECEKAGTFDLEVSYRVPGATWEPLYEARAASDTNQLQWTSQAVIRQHTGEDWNNVRLKISTANPAVEGTVPELQPRYLSQYTPPAPMPVAAYRKLKSSAPMAEAMDMVSNEGMGNMQAVAMSAPVMVEAQVVVAEVQSIGPAVQYILPKMETIISDGQPKKVVILSNSLSADFEYEIVPRLSPQAYRKAKVKNTTDGILLPGQVQIFMDDAFVGSSSIKLLGLGEKFNLSLGVDERVHVEFKRLKAKEDVSLLPGAHGRIKTIDYEFLIQIESFLGTQPEVAMRVVDQIPVSQQDEIKVEQVVMSPVPADELADKPGIKVWKLKTLKTGKQQIKIAYRVKYPVDFTVQGLD